MSICQIIILFLLALGFLRGLWIDFRGVKAREPYGFGGAIATVVITSLLFLCYWKAGAFSTLLP